jgi:hypothetical protein
VDDPVEAGSGRAALIDAFASFPARFTSAARGFAARASTGEAQAAIPAGEWGPAEVARHLIAVEGEVWQSRLARVAAEDDPTWPWTEPGLAPGFDGAPLEDVLVAFAAARAATAATVRALDEPGWARYGTHATYGRLDVAGLLRIAIDHDASHLEGLGTVAAGDGVDPGTTNPA